VQTCEEPPRSNWYVVVSVGASEGGRMDGMRYVVQAPTVENCTVWRWG